MVKIQGKIVDTEKNYYQHTVTIPNQIMSQLGWQIGENLFPKLSADGSQLIFEKQKPSVRRF